MSRKKAVISILREASEAVSKIRTSSFDDQICANQAQIKISEAIRKLEE